MKTLIFVHGGESFTSEIEYRDWISSTYVTWMMDPWEKKSEKTEWREEIAKKSKSMDFVYFPQFPGKLNARYEEWKLFFDSWIEKIQIGGEIVFIGTSLGGCFLLKYFSECSVIAKNEAIQGPGSTDHGLLRPRGGRELQINQIHLLAACIQCGDFSPPENYEYLQQVGNRLHIWHTEDDKVVPFAIAGELSRTLPAAQTHFFSSEKGYGHFYGVERIPELEEVIFGE